MAVSSLDANVLLRLTFQDLPEQYERAKRLITSVPQTFRVSHAAMSEYVFALQHHYCLDRTEIGSMVRWVVSLPTIVGDYHIILAAVATYERHPQLSFTDCYLAEEAVAADETPLWTFDKKLARQHEAAREIEE